MQKCLMMWYLHCSNACENLQGHLISEVVFLFICVWNVKYNYRKSRCVILWEKELSIIRAILGHLEMGENGWQAIQEWIIGIEAICNTHFEVWFSDLVVIFYIYIHLSLFFDQVLCCLNILLICFLIWKHGLKVYRLNQIHPKVCLC